MSRDNEEWAKRQTKDGIRLPACLDLLNWTQDPVAVTDSSEAIFNVDFKDMSIRDVQLAMDFAAGCQAHVPQIAAGRFNVDPKISAAVVANPIDNAFATATAAAEAMTSPKNGRTTG